MPPTTDVEAADRSAHTREYVREPDLSDLTGFWTESAPAELGGEQLEPGDKVLMFYWAANRDPAHFDHPERFDVLRSPNPHIGFGGPGPHFCLGAHLARREIGMMFRELLTRVPDIHATAPPSRLSSSFINGIKRLPVDFTTSTGGNR